MTAHLVKIETSPQEYSTATCSCGWKSGPWAAYTNAFNDACKHERVIAEHVTPFVKALDTAAIDAWIAKAFAGHGVALREENAVPIPGEPFMSMATAKEITARALKIGPNEWNRAIDQASMIADAALQFNVASNIRSLTRKTSP